MSEVAYEWRLHPQRGRPYGDAQWTVDAVKANGVEWTVRDHAWPVKAAARGPAERGRDGTGKRKVN